MKRSARQPSLHRQHLHRQSHWVLWMLSRFFFLWILLLGLWVEGEPVAAEETAPPAPWLAGPFQAPAEAIYKEAVVQSKGVDASALMLFQGVEYKFSSEGRLEIRRHWIYRILDDSALEGWSASQMRWSPWHQDRPEIKARVIREGGSEVWLKPEGIEEKAAPESADGLSGERRLLFGRLPGVETGAVVEEAIVLREKRPSFPWGTTHRHYTALFIPTVRGQVVLDASTRLALRFGVRKMPGLEPSSTEVADGRVRVTFDFFDVPPVSTVEEGLPAHRPRYPHITFSTGRSWNWVATGLGQLFEKVVTKTRLDALAADLPAPSDPLPVRLDKILAVVRDRIEYNGLEITASPLNPDPDRVLETGSGDGFDIALTLVAAFRRVGLESSLALINSGFGADVEPRLPGFGLFNHALVRVSPGPGSEPVWIDPIAPFSRPGELPLAAQGRFALIIGPDTEEPILTPATQPEENLARETRQVYFSDFGPGRVFETCEYHGSAERSQRRITKGLSAETRRRGYLAYARAFHQAAELGELQEAEAEDLSEAFVLKIEAINSNRARTTLDRAVLEIPTRELARRMPPIFLEDREESRQEEYVFPEPFVTEWRYEIYPPSGFVISELPADEEHQMGPATFSRQFRREREARGERVVGELRFDVGQRLLAPSQFVELRRSLREFLARPVLEIHFPSIAGQSLEAGELGDAFRDLQEAVSRDPGRASLRVRLSQALLSIGMAQEAERQAQQAVALAPRWGIAHWALAMSLEYDDLGRRFSPRAPIKRAAESLAEATRLSPNNPMIRSEFPRLLLRSADGNPGPGAEIEDAIRAYKKWRKDFSGTELDAELTTLLLTQRRWSELSKLLAEIDPGTALHLTARAMDEGVDSLLADDPAAIDRPAVALELIRVREYGAAERLLRVDGALPKDWAWLTGLVRVENPDLHPQDPRTPVQRLILALGSALPTREALLSSLHSRLLTKMSSKDLKMIRNRFDALIPPGARSLELPEGAWADLVFAGFEPSLSGAPHLGYRVSVGDAPLDQFFVSTSAGELRIAGFGSLLSELGVEALERLDQGDLPGVRRWLDWAFEALPPKSNEDPVDIQPLRYLWHAGEQADTSRRSMRIAAAALAAASDRSGASLSILKEATPSDLQLKGNVDSAHQVLALDVARLQTFSMIAAYPELEALAKDVAERYPSSAMAYRREVEALTALGEWETFVKRSEARLERNPKDVDARRALAHWALRQPDPDAADRHFSVVQSLGELAAGDAGTWLFAMIIENPMDLDAAWAILKQTEAEGRADALWLRAETMLLAQQGRATEARESLVAAIELQGTDKLTVEDGFLLGRIAEGAGVHGVARDLYSRLLSNQELRDRSPLVYVLAESAFARLSKAN